MNSEKWIKQFEDTIDDLIIKSKIIEDELNTLLKDDKVIISSRVKDIDSLKEKIVRNKYFLRYKEETDLFDFLNDGIGLRVVCLEQKDEKKIYKKLVQYHDDNIIKSFKFIDKSIKNQPEYQKNGHSIYRINASLDSYNFELQIKSTTHMLWGEIEHLLFYKNYSCYIGSNFLKKQIEQIYKDLLSINERLSDLGEYMEISTNGSSSLELKEISIKMLQENVQEKISDYYFGIKLDFRHVYKAIIDEYFYSKNNKTTKKKKMKQDTVDKIKYDDFAEVLSLINKLNLEDCNQLEMDINYNDIARNSSMALAEAIEYKTLNDLNKDEWVIFVNITSELLSKDVEIFVVDLANRLSKRYIISLENELETNLEQLEKIIFSSIVKYFKESGDFTFLNNMISERVTDYIYELFTILIYSSSGILYDKETYNENLINSLVQIAFDFENGKKLSEQELKELFRDMNLKKTFESIFSNGEIDKEQFLDLIKRGVG